MRLRRTLAVLLLLVGVSCAPTPTPVASPTLLSVFVTPDSRPWLDEAFACAADVNVALNVVPDMQQADFSLRLGEPVALTSPAFQIGSEEILVAVFRESPLEDLSLEQARALFAGDDPSVQVWVYASGGELQGLFDQLVMAGRPVTSFARVAPNPQVMAEALNAPGAVGILPGDWVNSNLRSIYSLGSVPVLAIMEVEPQGALKDLIACLQK
ncbi:MAG: hypothetical protein HY869_10280 [Chloroflexi bacterium]|nr:hypothetical protein [Chloroflexota bacterium]